MIVIQSYVVTFIILMISFGFAYILAKSISKLNTKLIQKLKFVFVASGMILLTTAAVGKLGWSIQTVGGTSPVEVINNALFWILSQAGVFLIFTDIWITYLQHKQ